MVPNAQLALHVQQVDPAYLRETSAEGQLFAIVDGCAAPDLPNLARALGPERAVCLYLGTAAENYADKAPYLIRVDPTLLSEWRERFGADAWGCLFTSSESWDTVRRHLRSLLTVSSPEGEAWLFRFWDPRLLPAFLRASQPDELNAFFGPVATFAVIQPDGAVFGMWRHLAIMDTPARRPVGGRYRISPAQVRALRRDGVGARLAATFPAGGARLAPDDDAVLVRTPNNGAMRLSLAQDGLVDGVTSPLGRRWTMRNREDGKLAELRTPSGSMLTIGYDAQGRVEQVARDGQPRFQARHDRLGRTEQLDFPDGTAAHTLYHLQGSAALNDPDGDLIAARRDRLGRVERFGYDGHRLTAIEDGGGSVTRVDYDANDRVAATCFADGGREAYRYDPAGHLARLTRTNGSVLDVEYDDAGRPTRIVADDGSEARFAYDEAGRLVAADNSETALAWTYDDAGRLTEERQGDTVVLYHHDESGQVGLTYPDGQRVDWRRDVDQRLEELTDWTGARYAISYADADAGWRLTGPDGVVTTNWQDTTGFTVASRVESPGGVLCDVSYVRDGEDRLEECRDSRIGDAGYVHDAEGQLLSVTRSSGHNEWFGYDGAGNRTGACGAAARFDAGNRLVAEGERQFRHDTSGALVERSGPEGTWRFRYDGFERLILAEDHQGRRITFGYDPLGRRVWKRARHGAWDTLTRFHWAGEQLIREVIETVQVPGDAPSISTRDYFYWPQSYTPFLLRQDGAIFRYHNDTLGAPVRLTAPGGRIVWEAELSAFGRARPLVAEIAQPLRLPGQYADDEFGIGLHYNRFRYYDPQIGRYISRDPIGVAGGLNPYLYAGNNPLHQADPLGLWWKTALAVVAGVAVAAVVVIAAPIVLPALGIAAGTMLAAGITTVAAGAAAGAVSMGLNEALNQESFCASCIALAALKGAGVGALAALPFVFLPATAGVAAYAAVGAGSGLIGYAGDVLATGQPWNWNHAAIAIALGAGTAGLGRYVAGRLSARTPPASRPAPAAAPATRASMSMTEAVGPSRANQWTTAGRGNAAAKGVDISHLSDDQVAAIHGYTTNEGYTQLNPALRGQTAMTPETEAFSTHLTEGMDRLPPYDGVSTRGSTPPQSVLDGYKPGSIVSDAAPKSTAVDPNRAFDGNLIETVQGTSGRDISAFSNFPETEVLFKPGTQFEVLDRVTTPSGQTLVNIREIP